MNDRTAKILLDEERYPRGANAPTRHIEYACPCGKGRVIEERVVGFGDYCAWLKCRRCTCKVRSNGCFRRNPFNYYEPLQ